MQADKQEQLILLTAGIVSAHVSHNSVAVNDLPQLIRNVHGSLVNLGAKSEKTGCGPLPAVPVRASVKPDYIVCLEDGKKLTMLKRHLMTHYQLTPDEYRRKWDLPSSYPMVAPNYSAKRRDLARAIGLGTGGRRKRKGERKLGS